MYQPMPACCHFHFRCLLLYFFRLIPAADLAKSLLNSPLKIPSLKLTVPENRPKPNRKGSYSNHPFLGAMAVSFREGNSFLSFVVKGGT